MHEDLLQKFRRDLALRGYSQRTQDIYYRNICSFIEFYDIPPEEITREQIKDYLYHLVHNRNLSESSLRQARGAVCYFFSQTLGKPIVVDTIPVHKKKRKLPEVFSVDDVARLIRCADNLKHRTILMLVYSSGLRVGELVNLQVHDIVRNSMRIRVRDAKGGKDRYTILAHRCLQQLELYWKTYRPTHWLFCGQKPGTHISIRAVQHAYQRARKNAGITRECGIHTLRHSFATHMLESGSGIFQLQKFMGHRNLKTTLVYVHLSEEHTTAQSPLDAYADMFSHGNRK